MKENLFLRYLLIILLALLSKTSYGQLYHQPSNILKQESDNSTTLSNKQHTEVSGETNGDTLVLYEYEPMSLGVSLENNEFHDETSMSERHEGNVGFAKLQPSQSLPMTSNVGSITINEGVSPMGARTYDIPIMTAAGCKLTPNISLSYNSQSGNGVAGYGWNVSGGSAITAVGKSIFYDGEVGAVNLAASPECTFSLDGVRLVENLGLLYEYDYETAQGYILAKKHLSGNDVAYFTVAYPNGCTATFGFTNNTRTQPIYPITELRDHKGHLVNFIYESSGNCYYLSRIRYGGTSADNHPAEIAFDYVPRQDHTTIYVDGIAMSPDRLLSKITSSDMVDGARKIIREYTLAHTFDEVSLLTQVSCASDMGSLPCLAFEYGTTMDNRKPAFVRETACILSTYFNTSKSVRLDILRGKFIRNGYDDGLVMLPGCFEPWAMVGKYVLNILGKKYEYPVYGSNYPENQSILIAPSLSNWNKLDSIKTDKGFQTIQAVNINGCGNDKIVKVNVAGCGKNSTRFVVTEYGYVSDTLSQQAFSFAINRSFDNGNKTYSPAMCTYHWGDFHGNGKAQLLIASYDQKDKKKVWLNLVDLDRKTHVGECLAMTDFDYENGHVLCALDIDSDGKTELCRATKSGVEVYAMSAGRLARQRIDASIDNKAFGERAVWGSVYTYDKDGRYLVTSTDAIGKTTTYSSYGINGRPGKTTGHNGLSVVYSYDLNGDVSNVSLPDATRENVGRAWGGKGLYTVTKDSDKSPSTVVHYDALDREVRSGTLRFDGSWQFVDKEYDSRGRLARVSLPFVGDAAKAWGIYEYDEYDRPISYTEPSGRTTTWSYNGRETTETKDGVVTTHIVDEAGRLVSATDAGGTLCYTLRPDGQTSEIVAPGNARTTYNYDAYGRRTSVSDPSFGTQTFCESYAKDGSRTLTMTDADGNVVTTAYDKYGRKTNETRPEFSTSYAYDTDGNLIEERSSNGALTIFGYDKYGRLLKKSKSIYNKSIEKSYIYTKGKLSREKITVGCGSARPETFTISYTYENNHMTEATIDDATTIWRLVSANEYGQPTEVVTGEMTRRYDFDAYGMPTRRRAGEIMD